VPVANKEALEQLRVRVDVVDDENGSRGRRPRASLSIWSSGRPSEDRPDISNDILVHGIF